MKYAPIIIGTHDRYEHLKKCIQSLAKNKLASESVLIVGIDFPASHQYIENNKKIIDFCEDLTGFERVIIHKRKSNLGGFENFRQLREFAFNLSDRVIISEDDNLFHTDFLSYINKGLDLYKDNDDVFSVCGYNFEPISKENHKNGTLFLKSYSAWGTGLWRDKFNSMPLGKGEYNYLLKSFRKIKEVNTSIGMHVLGNYMHALKRDKVYGDTWISLYLYEKNKYCLFPESSLVKNFGHDGSGEHCRVNNVLNEQVILYEDKCIEVDKKEVRELPSDRDSLNEYFKLGLIRVVLRVIRWIELRMMGKF